MEEANNYRVAISRVNSGTFCHIQLVWNARALWLHAPTPWNYYLVWYVPMSLWIQQYLPLTISYTNTVPASNSDNGFLPLMRFTKRKTTNWLFILGECQPSSTWVSGPAWKWLGSKYRCPQSGCFSSWRACGSWKLEGTKQITLKKSDEILSEI